MSGSKKVQFQFQQQIVAEARGKGIKWRLRRRFWWHRFLTELRDGIIKQIEYVRDLILRDMKKLNVDEDPGEEILGWLEDNITLRSEKDARRFQRVVRNVLGSDWSERAITSELKTAYHVDPRLRAFLKENRSVRKEIMRRMKIKPVVKSKRRVTRAIQGKPRRGDDSRTLER